MALAWSANRFVKYRNQCIKMKKKQFKIVYVVFANTPSCHPKLEFILSISVHIKCSLLIYSHRQQHKLICLCVFIVMNICVHMCVWMCALIALQIKPCQGIHCVWCLRPWILRNACTSTYRSSSTLMKNIAASTRARAGACSLFRVCICCANACETRFDDINSAAAYCVLCVGTYRLVQA